jgi:hypothetical protein
MPHGSAQLEGFLTESKHLFYLNLKQPGDSTNHYERLARGFSSFEPEMNEETDQTAYLDGGGFATTTVMGGQATISFSGHRYYGDLVQDWIFEHMISIGNNRETDFIWIQPTGEMISGAITLAVINGPSGDANSKGEIEVEVHFNGEPILSKVSAPTGLEASSITATGLELDWDAVTITGATVSYNVYQNGLQVASNVATPTYSATGLTASTEYQYYVVAVAQFTGTGITVTSAPSEIETATTIAA